VNRLMSAFEKEDKYEPLEKLTLLATHAIDWKHIPSDFNRWTPSDIAARLAKVSRGASLLGRVKVAGQTQLVPVLVRELRTAVVQAHIRWPDNKKTRLQKLAEYALIEVIDPRACKLCGGASSVAELGQDGRPTGKIRVCANCEDGKVRHTDYARYTYCEVHQVEWERKWNRPYVEILAIAKRWETEVEQAVTA
jgi:hypothetical protein